MSETEREREGRDIFSFYLPRLWNPIPHSFPPSLCQLLFFVRCRWGPLDTEEVVQLIPDPHWRRFTLKHTHTHTSTNPLFFLFLTHKPLSLNFFSFLLCSPSLLVTSLPSQHRYECQTTKRYHRKGVGKHWHHHWEGETGGKDHLYVFFPSFEWHCCFERSLISSVLIILYLLTEMSELSLPWNVKSTCQQPPYQPDTVYHTQSDPEGFKFRSRTSFWLFLWLI